MKKAGVLLTVLLISILLLTNITLAQTTGTDPTSDPDNTDETEGEDSTADETDETTGTPNDPDNLPDDSQSAKTILDESAGRVSSGIKNLDKYAEYDVEIPEKLRLIARIVLGIDQNKILLQNLIILIALWILFYLFFNEILTTFSLFSEATMRIAALLLVIILGTTGTLNSFTIFLLGANLKFLGDWSAGALAFWLILGLLLWMIVHRTLKHFKKMEEKTEAKERGWLMGLSLGVANSMSKAFHKIAGGSTYRVEKDS